MNQDPVRSAPPATSAADVLRPDERDPAVTSTSSALYTLERFARLTGYLSVEALQAYAQQGLLLPAGLDPVSGQPFYTQAQYEPALLLSELHYHQLPPEQCRAFMRDPTLEHQHEMLAWQLARLEAQGELSPQQLQSLRRKRAHPWRGQTYPVLVEDRPAAPFVYQVYPLPADGIESARAQAFTTTRAALQRHGVTPDSPPTCLYPNRVGADATPAVASGFEVPDSVIDDQAWQHGWIPGGHWYHVRHLGPYEHLWRVPLMLRDRVEQDGHAVHQLHGQFITREVFVVGPWDTPDAAQWVTDTCWLT